MIYLAMILVAAAVAMLAWLSSEARLGLKGLALHPFNIFGALLIVLLFDLWVLHGDVSDRVTISFAGFNVGGVDEVNGAIGFFMAWMIAAIAGITVAVMTQSSAERQPPPTDGDKRAAQFMFLFALAAAGFVLANVVLFSAGRGNLLYVAANRTVFFRQNPQFTILWSLLIPGLILFGSKFGLSRRTVAASLLTLAVVLMFGQRGAMFYVFIALGFWIAQRWKALKIPALYVGMTCVGFAIVWLRYFMRLTWKFPTFEQFLHDQGGVSGALFRSPDISLAEAASTIVGQHTIHRGIFDGIIAALTAPIPRALIPWKPLGASTQYTMEGNTSLWAKFTSESVIGGPQDIYLSFGYVGAVLAIGLLAYAWARWICDATARGTGAFVGPVSIILLYAFLRNDTYNTALTLWPLALVLIGYRSIRAFNGARPQSMSGARQQQRTQS